jgi:manganese/iron transport system permease protein
VKELLTNPEYRNALVTACALGVACALLSVLVVLRRWAFIGEGISHAGFGGIGTAWVLSLAVPVLGTEGAAYTVAIVFCLAMAVIIGWVSRRERINADAAIGIVLVGSLAWGVVALDIYQQHRHGAPAASGWQFYLLGEVRNLSSGAMWAGVCVSAAVVVVLAALAKEILFYCMDPDLAEVSGVRAGFVHYLLMLMLALMIVVGMRPVGYLLVTALLVLPGATGLVLSRRMGVVVGVSVGVSLVGVVGGLALRASYGFQSGPAMVLVLVGEFVIVYAWGMIATRSRAG